jgi:CO/xanthine dehydrogenase Mo-binding subunit
MTTYYGLKEGEEYKPWLWQLPQDGFVGKRGLGRRDGYDKASGKAMYSRDIYIPGMLYSKFVESPYPHARIKSMDTSAAEALPGVRAVIRYDDEGVVWPTDSGRGGEARWYPQPLGAIVVADTELLVDEAIRLIHIEWEVKYFNMDWNAALEPGATILFPDVNPDNNLSREVVEQMGDVEVGMAESPNIIDVEFNVEPDAVAGVEGGCCVAVPIGNDAVKLWPHTQQWAPLALREGPGLMNFFPWLKGSRLFPNAHMGYNGGMFGALVPRNMDPAKCAIMAARLTGKPVKFLLDYQHFSQLGEHLGTYKMTIGFKDNGEVVAVKYHTIMCSAMADQLNKIQKSSKIKHLYITKTYPHTNVGGYSCYKHGDAPVSCMIEVFEQVAAALGMDPTEVAVINDGYYGDSMEYINEHVKAQQGFDPGRDSLKEILAIGKQAMDWDNKWHQPGTKKLPNGNYHGMSMLWMNSWTHTPRTGMIGLRMHHDGTCAILGQSADIGVNRDTTYALVVADELGLNYEDVYMSSWEYSGFETIEPGGSSGMSGTLPELVRACKKLKEIILGYALKERPGSWGAPAQPPLFPDKTIDDLDIQKGMIFERANPTNKQPVRLLASTFSDTMFAWDKNPAVSGVKTYCMGRQCYFMEVEVDPDTGGIEVEKIVVVNDAGKVVNPESFEGQQFSVYMGLGRCKQEQIIWDPVEGVRLTDNLLNYDIAVMDDCKAMEVHQIETGLGYSAYGGFGIGESAGACGCVLTRYAVHNAIGKWVDLKTTPDKILKALGKA